LPKCRHGAEMPPSDGVLRSDKRLIQNEIDDGFSPASEAAYGVAINSNELDRIEQLVAELRAVEWWDVGHWRKRRPEDYEILAFRARQERRSEILSQLVSLIRRLKNMDTK
jgi:hypothetical protein